MTGRVRHIKLCHRILGNNKKHEKQYSVQLSLVYLYQISNNTNCLKTVYKTWPESP